MSITTENYAERSVNMHRQYHGKIEVRSKIQVNTLDDLSLAYTPGVAEPCLRIQQNPNLAKELTIKYNTVAVVTDGSAVLGLGNIGALGAIPVMEGKALLFKKFANIDAFPICLQVSDPKNPNPDEIIKAVRMIAPVFGGINLEDIAAPNCFVIEDALQDLGIPVFHDDQHGTAIVQLAALINALKVTNKQMQDIRVVICGAGAAGVAIAKMLSCQGYSGSACTPVKDIIVCDSQGIIGPKRRGLNWVKQDLLNYTNLQRFDGDLRLALRYADVFIGVSGPGLLQSEDIRTMAPNPIVFALANPTPEILPADAFAGGAAVVGTGRSDFPNQINNVLAFPAIFRGALDGGATHITPAMKLAAAYALANCIPNPTADRILPSTLDTTVAPIVAKAVQAAI